MSNIKSWITDILAYVIGIGTVIGAAIEAFPDGTQWYIIVGAIAVAVISWFTGRNGDGSKKKVPAKS